MEGEIKFPSQPTIEGASMSELMWFLYGPPGIGKTTFFSKIKGALFLYTDPGLRFVRAFKHPIGDWKQFRSYVNELVTRRPSQYSIIVIDTIDLLFNMCSKHVCRKRGIEHMSDEGFGKGYDLVKSEFAEVIQKLAILPYGVAFISHSKEVEIRGRTQKTSKIVPTLSNQARSIIIPMCDIMAYAGYEEEAADRTDAERCLIFAPSETLEAKDRTNLLPEKCDLSYEAVQHYLKDGGVGDEIPARKATAVDTGLVRKKKKKVKARAR